MAAAQENGVMIFDDYDWKFYNDPHLLPKMAVDAFIKIYEQQLDLLHKGYQIAIRKKDAPKVDLKKSKETSGLSTVFKRILHQ
jgi:hypothetical protein